jgi:hypothetical protein
MRDLTCIYYTHNKERPEFEARIQRTLWHSLKKVGAKLISVSQKPIDFGYNICVGDVGISGNNTWRQFQIGVEAANTKYVCPAESDYLHPIEYFTFNPPSDKCLYIGQPLYVLFAQRKRTKVFAPKPEGSEAAMVVNRDYILNMLNKMWDGRRYNKEDHWIAKDIRQNLPYLFKQGKCEYFNMSAPLVTFKTDENMHRRTRTVFEGRISELPYWGTAQHLIRKYCK